MTETGCEPKTLEFGVRAPSHTAAPEKGPLFLSRRATTVWTKKPGLDGMQLFLNVRKLEHHTSARLGWCPSSCLGSEDTYLFSSPRPPWASPCVNQGFQTGEGKLQMGQEPSLGGPACQARLFEQPSSHLTTALTPEQRNFI